MFKGNWPRPNFVAISWHMPGMTGETTEDPFQDERSLGLFPGLSDCEASALPTELSPKRSVLKVIFWYRHYTR